jgi:hypothetical protein
MEKISLSHHQSLSVMIVAWQYLIYVMILAFFDAKEMALGICIGNYWQ